MPRNKSIDSKKTSIALKYYYDEAIRKGVLEKILEAGGFSEDAIKAAIAKGHISTKMIMAFEIGVSAELDILIGKKELNSTDNSIKQVLGRSKDKITTLTYDEISKAINLIIDTQKMNYSVQREELINEIRRILLDYVW